MTDICIVGAGFVGLSFGIAAARLGFKVRIVDRKPAPPVPDTLSANVIAVNTTSSAFLSELGAWQNIGERFRPAYSSMSVIDATGVGSIHFTAEEAGQPVLGHIVDQCALLAALAESAATVSDLTLVWEASADVSPGDVPLLVGADGAHSRIREAVGLRKIGFSYKQVATVCLARLEKPHGNEARQWFHASGPIALLPLSEPDLVAVVWSSFEDPGHLDELEFASKLSEAIEGSMGRVTIQGSRFSFPLMQQQSLQYVAEGVALLGDAAHAIHPLAGQGANLGFADARCLATELASARLEGRSPGSLELLKRYEKARKPHNHMAALAMEGFHRLFTSRWPLVGLVRNLGLRFVEDQTSLKQIAINVAAGRV